MGLFIEIVKKSVHATNGLSKQLHDTYRISQNTLGSRSIIILNTPYSSLTVVLHLTKCLYLCLF
jgi:hypothetical protein